MTKPTITRVNHRAYIVAVAVLSLIFIGIVIWWTMSRSRQVNEVAIESPEASPTATGSVIVTVPSPSLSPSPTLTPSPSPTIAVVLPESASTFLANFYAAFSAANRSRIANYFTVDTNTELRELSSLLFTGKDLQGNPGGPYLFDSATTSERATGYSVISAAVSGRGWQVVVQEQRVTVQNTQLSPVLVELTLVPGSAAEQSAWLIDRYVRQNGADTGKYAAFFSL